MGKGLFITLEGIEGVGKTTQVDYVGELFRRQGHSVTMTREPGGTSVGEAVREILLNSSDLDICDETELLMIFAARAQHLRRVIAPALANGDVVICDRFTDASFAYQGGGRGIKKEKIQQLQSWVQGKLEPDLTLLLDATQGTGLTKAGKRGELDRFEQEKNEFFEKVGSSYLELAEENPQRIAIIDACKNIEEVQGQIDAVLASRKYLG